MSTNDPVDTEAVADETPLDAPLDADEHERPAGDDGEDDARRPG